MVLIGADVCDLSMVLIAELPRCLHTLTCSTMSDTDLTLLFVMLLLR